MIMKGWSCRGDTRLTQIPDSRRTVDGYHLVKVGHVTHCALGLAESLFTLCHMGLILFCLTLSGQACCRVAEALPTYFHKNFIRLENGPRR